MRQPDIGLISSALGWKPVVDVRDGLTRTIEWFRGHPELYSPGRSGR